MIFSGEEKVPAAVVSSLSCKVFRVCLVRAGVLRALDSNTRAQFHWREGVCRLSLHSHSRRPNARAHHCPHRSAVGCGLAVVPHRARTGEFDPASPYPTRSMRVVMLLPSPCSRLLRTRRRLAGRRAELLRCPSPAGPFRHELGRSRRPRAHRMQSPDQPLDSRLQRVARVLSAVCGATVLCAAFVFSC